MLQGSSTGGIPGSWPVIGAQGTDVDVEVTPGLGVFWRLTVGGEPPLPARAHTTATRVAVAAATMAHRRRSTAAGGRRWGRGVSVKECWTLELPRVTENRMSRSAVNQCRATIP